MAIRFLAATKKSPLGTLQLQCHVKPGAARAREGVLSVRDDVVELCVAAQAREGEANRAVVRLLSEVRILPPSLFPPPCSESKSFRPGEGGKGRAGC